MLCCVILCIVKRGKSVHKAVKTLFGEFPDERPIPPRVLMMYMVRDGQSPDRLEKTCAKQQLERLVWGYSGQYRA